MRRFVPTALRQAIRRYRHARAIRRGHFGDDDPLFSRLPEWVKPGQTVIDVGAAVGTYTIALSDLVGASGRVIAIEPLPEQFEVLVSNARSARHKNITCLEFAAGEKSGSCYMAVPRQGGIPNWYMAQVSAAEADAAVLQVALDDLPLTGTVSFLKVDAEGHDFFVLRGANRLVTEHRPVIYAEAAEAEMEKWLAERGYAAPVTAPGSPNRVFQPLEP